MTATDQTSNGAGREYPGLRDHIAEQLELLAVLEAEQLGDARAEHEQHRLELLEQLVAEQRSASRMERLAEHYDAEAEAAAERVLAVRRRLEQHDLEQLEAAGLGWRLATWTDDDGNACEQLVAPGMTADEHREYLLDFAGLLEVGGEVAYRQLSEAERLEHVEARGVLLAGTITMGDTLVSLEAGR